MDLSIIIPIYNEETNLAALNARVSAVLDALPLQTELIYVNDGSRDRSLEMIREIVARDPRIHYINFSRNFGHQIAITAGLDLSTGAAVVVMDGDLQDPPELIPELLQKLKEGYEVVYAKRRTRQGESAIKLLTAKVFYRLLARITSVNIPLDTGDFRIMSRKVVNALKQMPEQNKFIRGQIAWIGYRQTFLEFDRSERAGGVPGYTYSKLIGLAMDGITSFSDLPLRMATISGFVVSGVAFLVMLYAIYARFFELQSGTGWPSIMVSILFLGGVQLMAVGVIGEYIARLGANSRQRPLYIIDDTDLPDVLPTESKSVTRAFGR
ncbi:glycosyltransferase family 2 protein [Hymenobacter cellulosivorans]|uniref:Glycosyltransferase family 2 protein n=1 Tax=Hymenobacter cellulosivorans TaxID=2932249 RepID=A0ABY4F848_9BACT|nr:glycosyltransferase family 2 protein [Hymenobacter cellulosivorans]UOQ52740.1 glycosyltransferase family 2 protein [Hymenobacter cellulosivorans]